MTATQLNVDQNALNELSNLLQNTLSPDMTTRRSAEKTLQQMDAQPNYGCILLMLSKKEDLPLHLRVSASITFKNYIKRNWAMSDDTDSQLTTPDVNKINEQDRLAIKASIIDLMLTSPEQIQRQLSDAISIISKEDFPDKWPNLLSGMVENLGKGDFHLINGVLRTAHSIFKRYRHEFQSNTLWKEIKYVLGVFANPLTELFKSLIGLIEQHANDANAVKLIFSSLLLVCKIFRSLNAQDLPEEFENTMDVWMPSFLTLLTYDNPLLHSNSDEAGLLEQVKSQICDNISLYAQNYGEEFADYLPGFVTAVWNLLTTTGLQTKYDMLVSFAIQFITAVVYRPQYRSLFENDESLKSICEKIVIPNLFLRDSDIEIFEDNPEEYIRKDIERSDVDTRRRAASDLVQALSSQFEKQIVAIFSQYVSALLQEFSANPRKNWRQKDVVLYLVTTLASRAQTKKHGTTKASELIDVVQFFESTLLPDLTDADVNDYPVIKADVMRYISTFRQQLPKEVVLSALPHLIRFMASTVPVVFTYACHTIERILTLKAPLPNNKDNLFKSTDLEPLIQPLLQNNLDILQPVTGENEYAIKTLMRVCVTMQEKIEPFVDPIIAKLVLILNAISKNPSKPQFNHYLFETFGVLIRELGVRNPLFIEKFESNLFPIFNFVLQQDITEFIPYSFQLLSLMLELHTQSIPSVYFELFPFLLMPVLWERPGYIPALTRLLQAYIEKSSSAVQEKITAVLGVFQRLISSKSNDHFAFYILNSLIEHLPSAVLQTYIKQILLLIFQRLSSSKTQKYVKNLLVCFSLYAYKYGTTDLANLINGLQAGMFQMVIEKLYILELQKTSGLVEKKICAVGVAKILTEYPGFFNSEAEINTWATLLEKLICLFEMPEDNSTPDDEHFIDVEDTPGYQESFNQLLSVKQKDPDPFHGEVPSDRIYLAKRLSVLSSSIPGQVPQLLSKLSIEAQKHLQKYLTEGQVQLS